MLHAAGPRATLPDTSPPLWPGHCVVTPSASHKACFAKKLPEEEMVAILGSRVVRDLHENLNGWLASTEALRKR